MKSDVLERDPDETVVFADFGPGGKTVVLVEGGGKVEIRDVKNFSSPSGLLRRNFSGRMLTSSPGRLAPIVPT